MSLVLGGWGILQLIVEILIWIAIAISLLVKRGSERLHMVIILAGYLIISFYLYNFFLAATLMTMWFLFIGVGYFVSRGILIVLLIIMLLLGYANPFFYFIAVILYIITLTNFIFSSFRQLKPKT